MTVNLRNSIRASINPGLRQSISGGVDALGLFRSSSLDLQFAAKKTLTDRVSGSNLITFNRASSGNSAATYVDSDGLIKASPVNLLKYSEQFNLWSKGSNTTITVNAVAAPDESMTADRVEMPATNSTYIQQLGLIDSGTEYTGSVWAKAVTPGTNNQFTFQYGTGAGAVTSTFFATGEWERFTSTVTPTDSGNFNINNVGDTFDVDVYLWGAQLQKNSTISDYVPSGSASSGAPRFDHDPATGESLGLLIEEGRTNQLLFSETFGQGAWTKSLVTVTNNVIVAPDGATTADKMSASRTANDARHIRQDSSIVAGKIYTQTVFAKAGEVTVLQIAPSSGFNTDFQNFDLSTGQLGSGGAGAATIEPYGNGWYRCSKSRYATSTRQGRMLIGMVNSATSARVESFQADAGDGLYLWGAQLEEDATFSSSYIPSTNSAVSRSPDIATIEGTNFTGGGWYNQSEGTIFSDISPLDADSDRAYLFSNGTDTQRLGQNTESTSTFALFMSKGSATSLSVAASGMPKPIKACLAYKPGSSRGVIDGQLQTLSTTSNVPNAINQIGLGSQSHGSGGGFLNGHIARFSYFPTRKADSDLVKMTS